MKESWLQHSNEHFSFKYFPNHTFSFKIIRAKSSVYFWTLQASIGYYIN